MVRCTKTSQAWTRSMSASTREMTHPNRATRNSPGLGGISMLHGRQGQDQAIWSKLPTSWQPGQIQVSATSRFWALCNAAGEKEPPVAKARASGPEAANFRIPSQSILWNKPFRHLKRECRIVQRYSFRWQQHCHHSAEALHKSFLQKSGCIPFPHPKLGYRIVHLHSARWQRHCHHYGEALYESCLQKSGCIPFPHPKVGCCIVHLHSARWQRHCHHYGEALYESCLQKSGCIPFPHPKVGCCIVHLHSARWQRHCHHYGEALYESCLQKSGCIPFPHPKVGCCIVHLHSARWQRHCHHSGGALYDGPLQKPGFMPFPHPKVGCRIVPLYCLRWQLHCHHFGEVLCEVDPRHPFLELGPNVSRALCANGRHSEIQWEWAKIVNSKWDASLVNMTDIFENAEPSLYVYTYCAASTCNSRYSNDQLNWSKLHGSMTIALFRPETIGACLT